MISRASVRRWWCLIVTAACALLCRGTVAAADVTPNTRDTLVYKDGDRVQGKLMEKTAETIVFKSDRFGELRVPAGDAVVIKAEKGAAAAPATATATPPPVAGPTAPPATKKEAAAAAEKAEQEKVTIWDRFSPAVLTAKVRNYFGPWHGRLAFSTELVTDVAKRNTSSYEGMLQRKWATDEVQLHGRFDYAKTNDVTTTDLVKAWGQWRHEFNKSLFALYRPTAEWNRASLVRNVPNDYVLLQQEFGAGFNLLTKPTRKVRAGLSENLFDTWNSASIVEHHTSRSGRSVFEETEFTLPWRITISQRGVWYPVPNQRDGWEHRFDLIKKLTETLSVSVRHEMRRNNPDGTAPDYDRLKLLFGFDF